MRITEVKLNFDMKKAIYLIILAGVLFACNRARENQQTPKDYNVVCIACEISDILADLIRRETADETRTNFDGESRVVYLVFYQIDKRNYLALMTASIYNEKADNRFCVFENKLLIYEGVNDKVAEKYINFKPRGLADIPKAFRYWGLDWGGSSQNHRERFFKLLGTEIIEFQPDREHQWKFFNLLVDAGNIVLPPPPPDGATAAARERFFNMLYSNRLLSHPPAGADLQSVPTSNKAEVSEKTN